VMRVPWGVSCEQNPEGTLGTYRGGKTGGRVLSTPGETLTRPVRIVATAANGRPLPKRHHASGLCPEKKFKRGLGFLQVGCVFVFFLFDLGLWFSFCGFLCRLLGCVSVCELV